MEIVAQLFSTTTFKRTEPFQIQRTQLAEDLKKITEPLEDCVVIVLMEKPLESEEFHFTLAPLYRADDFIIYFGVQDNGREKVHSTA